jgi:hypothetical protein
VETCNENRKAGQAFRCSVAPGRAVCQGKKGEMARVLLFWRVHAHRSTTPVVDGWRLAPVPGGGVRGGADCVVEGIERRCGGPRGRYVLPRHRAGPGVPDASHERGRSQMRDAQRMRTEQRRPACPFRHRRTPQPRRVRPICPGRHRPRASDPVEHARSRQPSRIATSSRITPRGKRQV